MSVRIKEKTLKYCPAWIVCWVIVVFQLKIVGVVEITVVCEEEQTWITIGEDIKIKKEPLN